VIAFVKWLILFTLSSAVICVRGLKVLLDLMDSSIYSTRSFLVYETFLGFKRLVLGSIVSSPICKELPL
jgi:hypothetical protein